jgi:hypothetical protein
MEKKDFVNKWCKGTETQSTDLRKVMMVDLNMVINKALKDREEFNQMNYDRE